MHKKDTGYECYVSYSNKCLRCYVQPTYILLLVVHWHTLTALIDRHWQLTHHPCLWQGNASVLKCQIHPSFILIDSHYIRVNADQRCWVLNLRVKNNFLLPYESARKWEYHKTLWCSPKTPVCPIAISLSVFELWMGATHTAELQH